MVREIVTEQVCLKSIQMKILECSHKFIHRWKDAIFQMVSNLLFDAIKRADSHKLWDECNIGLNESHNEKSKTRC